MSICEDWGIDPNRRFACEKCGKEWGPIGPGCPFCAAADMTRFVAPSTLQKRIGEWQTRTFGDAQTVQEIDCHLIRELQELLDAEHGEAEQEECADVLILLMGRAHLMGFNLLEAAEKKLAINQTRTWGKPDAQGVIEHSR